MSNNIFTLLESRQEKYIISQLGQYIDQLDDIYIATNLTDPVDELDSTNHMNLYGRVECTPLMYAIALGLDHVVKYMLKMPEMTIDRITHVTRWWPEEEKEGEEEEEEEMYALLIAVHCITRLSIFSVINLMHTIPSQHIPPGFIDLAFSQYFIKDGAWFPDSWVAEVKIVLIELLKRPDYNPIRGFQDMINTYTTPSDGNIRLRFLYHPQITKHISQIYLNPNSHPDGFIHLRIIATYLEKNPNDVYIFTDILAMYPETKHMLPFEYIEQPTQKTIRDKPTTVSGGNRNHKIRTRSLQKTPLRKAKRTRRT